MMMVTRLDSLPELMHLVVKRWVQSNVNKLMWFETYGPLLLLESSRWIPHKSLDAYNLPKRAHTYYNHISRSQEITSLFIDAHTHTQRWRIHIMLSHFAVSQRMFFIFYFSRNYNFFLQNFRVYLPDE